MVIGHTQFYDKVRNLRLDQFIKRKGDYKMDSSIKSLTITGPAAEDAMKPRRQGASRKKRTNTEEEQIGGDGDLIESIKRQVIPVKQIVKAPVPSSVQVVSPVSSTPSVINPLPPPLPLQGGKVILNPPKNQRVKLQPKQLIRPTPVLNQTRKARRIKLTVANITNRVTRAKRVHEDTNKKSIDTIRDFLIQKGVIQAKSKAPEKMLRSMYSDFMLLKDQAL
jgi:hypothetical protein